MPGDGDVGVDAEGAGEDSGGDLGGDLEESGDAGLVGSDVELTGVSGRPGVASLITAAVFQPTPTSALPIPNSRPAEGSPVARQTDNRPQALKPALDSMTLPVAAVIVHDTATNRVVLLQRSENAEFA